MFSGRAIYSNDGTNYVFRGVAEDVSDMISMISPWETPLLDRLGDATRPATNVLHEWLDDSLNPNTLNIIGNQDNATAYIGVVNTDGSAVTDYLATGMILQNTTTGEYVQISGIAPNTITVTRGFGGTTPASIGSGQQLYLISDAALEGADVTGDTSRPRVRKSNYTQIFKKDVIVSGTMQAVNNLGNVNDEYEYQKGQRLREMLRDLEKAVIMGKSSGNSLGTATAYRTMTGLWDQITTNVYSLATLTDSWLTTVIQGAWNFGATDLDLIIADASYKRVIDQFNSSRVHVFQGDNTAEEFKNKITVYENTFGTFPVVLGRWMPQNSLMVLSTKRVHVTPLQGRTFQHQPVAKTGDAMKGMLVGEYTVEVRNQEGLAKAYGGVAF